MQASDATDNTFADHLVFDTALGFVGIAWSEKGLTRLCLFQREPTAVERRLERLAPAGGAAKGETPAWVGSLIRDIRAYAEGEEIDEEEETEGDEEVEAKVAEDPYFARLNGGRRVKEIPDVKKFLSPE